MKKNRINSKARISICLVSAFAFVFGCNVSGQDEIFANGDSVAVMTWNVQTLFDDVEDGSEYADYSMLSGWTAEKYLGRLNVISAAVRGMERKPDIIALQEVESAKVIGDLAAALADYGWTHFASIPGMALGVGLLSRFPLSDMKAHSVTVFGDTAPRPMLEARVNVPTAEGGDLPAIIFVCHWKSKLGGEDVTESTRRASARIIVRRMRELLKTEPDLPVIITGDLNLNHDEFYRRNGSVISALLPDDPRSAELTGLYGLDEEDSGIFAQVGELQKDFIIVSKNKPPLTRYFPSAAVSVYTPWSTELQNGSYVYRNSWETIDHFLLSVQLFDGIGLEYDTCMVLNAPPFANASGYPSAYNPRTGFGMSDHLPLFMILKVR